MYETTPRSATAMAKTDGQILIIEGARFRTWINAHPEAGLPLAMALLQNSLLRMRHTNQQMALLGSASRLLSGGSPLEERVNAWKGLVRQSLDFVEGLRVFARSELCEEFQEVAAEPDESPISLRPETPLLARFNTAGDLLDSREPGAEETFLAAGLWPAGTRAALAVPLLNSEFKEKLTGFIVLASAAGGNPFDGSVRLVLSALSDPLTTALARESRSQETSARSRLEYSRARFTL